MRVNELLDDNIYFDCQHGVSEFISEPSAATAPSPVSTRAYSSVRRAQHVAQYLTVQWAVEKETLIRDKCQASLSSKSRN